MLLCAILANNCCLELGQSQAWQATLHLAREYEWTVRLLAALAISQHTRHKHYECIASGAYNPNAAAEELLSPQVAHAICQLDVLQSL